MIAFFMLTRKCRLVNTTSIFYLQVLTIKFTSAKKTDSCGGALGLSLTFTLRRVRTASCLSIIAKQRSSGATPVKFLCLFDCYKILVQDNL